MPYAERVTPTLRTSSKATTLPMPIAAFHNNEERHISSLYSFVRRKCVEYFASDDECAPPPDNEDGTNSVNSVGQVGLRCAFCAHLPPGERDPRSCIFPRQTVSIHAAVITLMYAHLPRCPEVPPAALEHMETLRERDLLAAESADPGRKKRYRWADVADEMGFKDTDAGIRFIPPEIVGRKPKRQATQQAVTGASTSVASLSSLESGNGASKPSSPVGWRAESLTPPLRADWTDDDDRRLWKGQNQLGNKWKEVAEQVFQSSFRGDQVRNRWYSGAFKDYVAKNFGRDAYALAQEAGKQIHGGGGPGGSQPSVAWTREEDTRLWNAQRELGNRWKDISARMGRANSDHVKTRWYSDKFKDFVATEFGKDAYAAAHVQGKQERQGARPQVEWTPEDDALLWTAACQDTGTRNWEEIARTRFASRMSDNHLKNRWYSAAFKKFVAREYGPDAYQNAKIGRRGAQSQVDWTGADDRMLWQSHSEMGNKWQVISDLKFAGRISENQVKNRWYSAPFKKFVAEQYGPDAHRNAKHKK